MYRVSWRYKESVRGRRINTVCNIRNSLKDRFSMRDKELVLIVWESRLLHILSDIHLRILYVYLNTFVEGSHTLEIKGGFWNEGQINVNSLRGQQASSELINKEWGGCEEPSSAMTLPWLLLNVTSRIWKCWFYALCVLNETNQIEQNRMLLPMLLQSLNWFAGRGRNHTSGCCCKGWERGWLRE